MSVYQITLEILMKGVGQNAFLILIVHRVEPASETNVLIRVQAHVAKTRIARLSIIYQHVLVIRVIPAIHLNSVTKCQLLQNVNHPRLCLKYGLIFSIVAIEENPCNPSPCGPNSQCRVVNIQPVCSCLPDYVGNPPGCRPECTISTECPINKACVNQKCTDPCPGSCGINANCDVINHSPICSCSREYSGNPFTRCFPIPSKHLYIFFWLLILTYYF